MILTQHPFDNAHGIAERPVINKAGDTVAWVGPRVSSIGAAKAGKLKSCYLAFKRGESGDCRRPCWLESIRNA